MLPVVFVNKHTYKKTNDITTSRNEAYCLYFYLKIYSADSIVVTEPDRFIRNSSLSTAFGLFPIIEIEMI